MSVAGNDISDVYVFMFVLHVFLNICPPAVEECGSGQFLQEKGRQPTGSGDNLVAPPPLSPKQQKPLVSTSSLLTPPPAGHWMASSRR